MSVGHATSSTQRALFTFLGFTLLGPFFTGFAVLAGLILAAPLKLDALIPAGMANPGEAAIAAFVWAAIPSALAALGLLPLVIRQGTFSWLAAAVAGGLAFMVSAIAMPLPASLSLTVLTGFAAAVALAVRAALASGRIIAT
ncbi:MAG: hypothetical protein JNM89_13225 [Hyphomicrobiaceae bacterium]|nr:hypothetical protein [Hyphomicrobiaceae bacterium]